MFVQSLILTLILSCSVAAGGQGNAERTLLNNPESIVFDAPRDRYLVSNWGHGDLIAIDALGVESVFNDTLDQSAGLHIVGDVIYATSSIGATTGVIGFDLTTGEVVSHLPIPEMALLNDITSDHAGNLYVTDCDANRIYRIRISDLSYNAFVTGGLGYPNGIIYDEANDRLLVLNGELPNGPLLAVALADSSLSIVAETNLTGLDGLTVDSDGYTYFSSWYTDRVYRYDQAFTHPPEVVSMGHTNPADIFFNQQDQILAIPNFHANRIDFVPIAQQSCHEETGLGRAPELTCHPNPCRGFMTISYGNLAPGEEVEIMICDSEGRCIQRIRESNQVGCVQWNGCNAAGERAASGIYCVTLTAGASNAAGTVMLLD